MTTFVYADADGTILARKVIDGHGSDKRVSWERPNGVGGWAAGRGGIDPPLYRLPEVLAAVTQGQEVWVTEGERDVESLRTLGLAATCNPDGAAGPGATPKWRRGHGEYLRGAQVVIVFDNDEAGRAHLQAIIDDLAGKAVSVRCLAVHPSLAAVKGADVTDHLDAGFTVDDLVPVTVEPNAPTPLGAVPAFPAGALTGPLAAFTGWAAEDGLHAAAAGWAGLAALASLCGNASLQAPFASKASLWMALIGPASSGKSPAVAHAFELIEQASDAEMRLWGERHAHWQETKDTRGRAAAGSEPLCPPSLTISDTTMEALATHLDETGGAAAIVVDELDAHLSSIGLYRVGKKSADADWARFRELWTGKSVTIRRVGKPVIRIANPALVVFGPLTPGMISRLGEVTTGDTARWLPARVPPEPPVLPEQQQPKPARWTDAVTRLIDLREQRRWWSISGDAWQVLNSANARWQAQARNRVNPPPEHVAQALGKAAMQTCRIALVLAESLEPGAGGLVPEAAVRSAAALVDYALGVWESLPGERSVLTVRREDQAAELAAHRLAAWLEARPPDERGIRCATRRQIQRAHVAGCRTPETVDEMIAAYAEEFGSATVTRVKNLLGPPVVVISEPPRPVSPLLLSPPPGRENPYQAGDSDVSPPVATEPPPVKAENTQTPEPAQVINPPEPLSTGGDSSSGDTGAALWCTAGCGQKGAYRTTEGWRCRRHAGCPNHRTNWGPRKGCSGCDKLSR